MGDIMRDDKKSNQEIVLSVLNNSTKIMSAYTILDKLKPLGISGPPTVYRALDALQSQGQVHRIESLNGFVACHKHDHKPHASAFIICSSCDSAEELHIDGIDALLLDMCSKRGFNPKRQTLEIIGTCKNCMPQQIAAL
jgi:Fur family zinc uptake transcriptional regulator